ncbi:hypothetical protein [Nocardia veterana]|uniref:Uncharacterized protein n=1 Tax=Nocardia veterana TaxID=132249 RepID=A0A7X6RHT6_9NOCA|nr:hypothetical protein [Nocardia veterana]NKY86375.1 hypothetical protein [Nocardia veterana]
MAKTTALEDIFLAPDDPAWGDERAREEFYRGSTLALCATMYGCYVIAIIAAAVDAKLVSLLIFILPSLTSLLLLRYCARRGIDVRALVKNFPTWRKRIAYATTYPLVAIWLAVYLWRAMPSDSQGLVGAVVGGLVGGVAAFVVGKLVRRRSALQQVPEDDCFDC